MDTGVGFLEAKWRERAGQTPDISELNDEQTAVIRCRTVGKEAVEVVTTTPQEQECILENSVEQIRYRSPKWTKIIAKKCRNLFWKHMERRCLEVGGS